MLLAPEPNVPKYAPEDCRDSDVQLIIEYMKRWAIKQDGDGSAVALWQDKRKYNKGTGILFPVRYPYGGKEKDTGQEDP